MRIAATGRIGGRQFHDREEFEQPRPASRWPQAEPAERLVDLGSDRHERIEAAHRILKDDADV